MEIQFNEDGHITGAAIRTYLLERSRVVQVNDPERNYHIFYQLADGASEDEKKSLFLGDASEYRCREHTFFSQACIVLNS